MRFSGSFWYIVCTCLYDVLVTKARYMKTSYPDERTALHKAWFRVFPLTLFSHWIDWTHNHIDYIKITPNTIVNFRELYSHIQPEWCDQNQ